MDQKHRGNQAQRTDNGNRRIRLKPRYCGYLFCFDFRPVIHEPVFFQLSSDDTGTAILCIHSALAVDKGQYTVKAVNIAGEAKCFSHVIVKAMSTFDASGKPSTDPVLHQFDEKFKKPEFVETFSSEANAYGGATVKFECIVAGKPNPKV